MNRWAKLGIVVGGYVLAFVASVVLVGIYDRHFTPTDNQQMGGMIAGGEMIYGVGIFLLGSLVPTAVALWFARGQRRLWSGFSVACLAFAIAGLAAVLGQLVTRGVPHASALMLVELFALAQMLGSPLWIGGFALFACLAPAGDPRRRMLVAAAIELAVAGVALVYFIVPRLTL